MSVPDITADDGPKLHMEVLQDDTNLLDRHHVVTVLVSLGDEQLGKVELRNEREVIWYDAYFGEKDSVLGKYTTMAEAVEYFYWMRRTEL